MKNTSRTKALVDQGKALIDGIEEKERQAEELVNDILRDLPDDNPVVVFDEPAYILMEDGGSWVETGVRSVRMDEDGLIRLGPWETGDDELEDGLWDEDDDSLRVNWGAILRQTLRALEKEAER